MDKNRPGSGAAVVVRRAGFLVMMGATAVCIMLPLSTQAQVAAEAAVIDSNIKPTTAGSKARTAKTANAKSGASAKTVMPGHPYTPVCVGEFSPTVNVNLPEGKSGMLNLEQLKLPSPAWLRSIGDQDIVKVEPLTSLAARNMFFLFGQKIGSTNLMFQNKDGNCAMVEVAVGVDTAAVQSKLSQLMPDEKNIKIGAAADSLVLSGMVSDAMAVDQVMAIAGAYLHKTGAGAGGAVGAAGGGERIVNMLSVAAPQQVMLEVKIAEVSKSLLDKLGVGTTLRTTSGSWAYTLLSNFLTGTAGGLLDATKSNGSQVTLEAEKRDGLVRILAEPTVMAISGQEGSFLAGGKIFIPVAQDNNKITLEEKDFGVGLKFTPTVLAGGRINIRVAPEVSELSREGIGISAAGLSGTNILPLITTRRAATTVQLHDGQSFAIGGLIKNNVTANIKGLPVLGEVPVLGALFRSTDFQQDKTELLFVITPHLVKPMSPDYALPTDNFTDPSRADVLLGGRLEGRKPAEPAGAAAAPATPAAVPMDQGQAQLNGPSGFELK